MQKLKRRDDLTLYIPLVHQETNISQSVTIRGALHPHTRTNKEKSLQLLCNCFQVSCWDAKQWNCGFSLKENSHANLDPFIVPE